MTSKKVAVTLTWNNRTREWVARHVAGGETIEQSGSTSKNARTFISQKLRERYGKNFEMEIDLELPGPVKERLAALQKRVDLLRQLTDEIPKERVAISGVLMDEYRLSQGETAEVFNLSQGWLNRQITSAKVGTSPVTSGKVSSTSSKGTSKAKR